MPTSSRETTREGATTRFFDAALESQAAIFDGLRSATDRYHRFNRSLIEGARQSSQDWTEVGRKWLANPTDLLALYEAATEAISDGQQRTMALAREWLEDQLEAQRETRESLRKGFGDVREAVERARADAPEFLRRGFRRSNGREETAKAEA
jgi:hypothetical protein